MASGSTASLPMRSAGAAPTRTVHFPEELPALRQTGLRHRVSDRRLLQAREDGIVLVDTTSASAAALLVGLPLRRARNGRGCRRHEKCTLCIDRIYNENLPEDRTPACVATCPSKARHFGDFADPNPVSRN